MVNRRCEAHHSGLSTGLSSKFQQHSGKGGDCMPHSLPRLSLSLRSCKGQAFVWKWCAGALWHAREKPPHRELCGWTGIWSGTCSGDGSSHPTLPKHELLGGTEDFQNRSRKSSPDASSQKPAEPPHPRRIILLRHGECHNIRTDSLVPEWKVLPTLQEWRVPLTRRGSLQVRSQKLLTSSVAWPSSPRW